MPTVAFRVRSTRIKDIELSPNHSTIADLIHILAADGYDVNEATRIRVIRRDAIVIGQMDSYVLRDGDCVEIDTNVFGPFDALAAREKREARKVERECTQGKCCKNQHKGPHIEVTRLGNLGIAIRVVED